MSEETQHARLLSPPHNYPVVQLPDRKYPGIVVQGDTFSTFVANLEEALSDPEDREFIITDLLERFRAIQASYEAVLDAAGIQIPYNRH